MLKTFPVSIKSEGPNSLKGLSTCPHRSTYNIANPIWISLHGLWLNAPAFWAGQLDQVLATLQSGLQNKE